MLGTVPSFSWVRKVQPDMWDFLYKHQAFTKWHKAMFPGEDHHFLLVTCPGRKTS